MNDTGRPFELGRFTLASGTILPQARIVYRTWGVLSPARDNAILYPTSFGAHHADVQWLVKDGGILDPTRWFIVAVNQFGNGLSSAPSNLGPGHEGTAFSHVDNVRAQERLLTEVFGIERLALAYGWSMGAQQAYHWGALLPERVARIAAICGTARTTDHCGVFLRSLEAALHADPAWDGTRFTAVPDRGFRAFARIYASWAASQAFYRAGLWRAQGHADLEDYLVRAWEAGYRRKDPLDLLSMLRTWMACDVAAPAHGGDLRAALGSITARTLVMPSTTDLYFTPEDCATEAALIPHARLRPIESIWGHRAGNPYQNPDDERAIRDAVHAFLAA